MQLNEIFAKDVQRPIEGVIKADDESSLYVELNEYVLTDEVAKRLEHFLDAANHVESCFGKVVIFTVDNSLERFQIGRAHV